MDRQGGKLVGSSWRMVAGVRGSRGHSGSTNEGEDRSS